MIQGSNVHLVGALIGALALFTLGLAVFLPYVGGQQRARTTDDDQKKLSSLAGRIPVCEIRDNLIVRRDGSFCAGWECTGVATQFASADRLEAVSSAMDVFIKGIRYSRAEFQFRYLIDHDTSEVFAATAGLCHVPKLACHLVGRKSALILECGHRRRAGPFDAPGGASLLETQSYLGSSVRAVTIRSLALARALPRGDDAIGCDSKGLSRGQGEGGYTAQPRRAQPTGCRVRSNPRNLPPRPRSNYPVTTAQRGGTGS
jgi:hypothetical protein